MDVKTLSTVFSIFLLLMAGYGAKRAGVLKPGDSSVINTIIIYLTFPAFVFVSVHGKPLTGPMIRVPFLVLGMELLFMGLAYLAALALKLDRRTTGALILVSVFGNTGFLGYPVISAAFNGDKHAILTAVMVDEFGMFLLLNTFGAAIAASFAGSKFNWNSIGDFYKTPIFLATVIALIFRTIQMPDVLMKTLGYLAAGTIPLAMISIGLNLSAGSVKRYPAAIGVAFIIKMVMFPLIMCGLLPMLGITGVVQQATILECAMPAAAFTGVISSKFGANGAFAASVIFVTTLASIITIPIVLALM